ncbi:M16 family metallopeptidase [Streptomyces afghaniensis]|uniref:M16 family metallopeptidase n=1 Tax=Streptomyces afghaniensis TaxID=66865 RepID=UPI00278ABD15|nr:pitrilysin family protein [Streptomyces afghaniensis]MDQ1018101.1 zinc protease [Streptomyces afghaniensis]
MTAPHRLTLRNGLRVLLAPSSASAVAVTVHYDVGFRSEPQGRSGFAHLFEHLMFQGSARYPKLDHWRYVQGLGGTVNGSTHQDYTDYHQLVPPAGLEQVLSMEADRMGELLITEETLSNQRAVVKEEIRLNVLNRPYGGFPWIPLPALLYRSYPNAHNGYGAFDDLDSATVADAEHFYRTYYVPSNAVLTVAGAFDPDAVPDLVDRHFGGLPQRPVPTLADLSEPAPDGVLRGEHKDPHAPVPALALGYRLPDPSTDTEAYVARMVLCDVLAGGAVARLHTRLVQDRRLALRVSAGCGLFNSLDARAPDTLALVVTHHETADPAIVLAEVDAELERLTGSPCGAVTALARRRTAMRVLRRNADLLARARSLGTYELLHGRAALVDELPGLIDAVTDADLRDAAAALLTAPRAELHLIPGNTQPSKEADQ